MHNALLREFVRRALREMAAVGGAAAGGKGVGMFVREGSVNVITLLDTAAAREELVSLAMDDKLDDNSVVDALAGCVVAHLECRKKQHGAHQVDVVAARKGYGPLVYDLAMTLFGAITSFGSTGIDVSAGATGVWNYYLKHRPDVTAEPLEPGVDPNDALHHKYSGAKADVAPLQRNAEAMTAALRKDGMNPNRIEALAHRAGFQFFNSRYMEDV